MCFGKDQCQEHALGADEDLKPWLARGDVIWIDVQGLGDGRLLERLQRTLDVHPLAMADAVNTPQRPKVEKYGSRLLIIAQMAQFGPGGAVELEQLSIIVGPHWIATIQERPGDMFDPVRARIRMSDSRIRTLGPDYLAYALLDAVTDAYFPVVESIAQQFENFEDDVLDGPGSETLEEIHGARRLLLLLHRTQWQQRDAIGALARDPDLPFADHTRLYLRDAHDHASQILDAIEAYREFSIGLMDLYLSSANHRMNEAMHTLTVVATIFIPLTFIVGVYGMNFRYMPELEWRWGYPAVWAVMIACSGALLFWFRGKGWVGGRRRR
jgi:magnesium transporter